jgi:flotillin
VAAEIAGPLSQSKKVTMVSIGKGEVGISKLTTEVFQIMERLPKMIEGVTGVDIATVRTF